ncbi:MAG: hypothetical protein ABH820_00710, partial [Patescibacteria group bacterium]
SQCHLYHRMITLYRSDMRPGFSFGAPPGHQRLYYQSNNGIYGYMTSPLPWLPAYPGMQFFTIIAKNRDAPTRSKLNFVLASAAFYLPLVNHPAMRSANVSSVAIFNVSERRALTRKYVPDVTVFYFLPRCQHFFFSEHPL